MKVYFCLPAYNEEKAIGHLLDEIFQVFRNLNQEYSVVVVNDGSTDKTHEVVEHYENMMPIELIDHPHNRGLGAALTSGLKYISHIGRGDDIIVCMDADNTHKPEFVPSMIEKIRQGCEVVIASRYCPESKVIGVSSFRLFMSFGARVLFRIFAPLEGIKDYTCGFRAIRNYTIRKAFRKYKQQFITQNGFACTDEILLKLSKITNNFGEVPFTLHYEDKIGASKLNLWTTVIGTLQLLLAHRK